MCVHVSTCSTGGAQTESSDPADFVWGARGLDSIISGLLDSMSDKGHPPAKKDKVDAIPIVIATQEIADESEYIHIHTTNSISIHIQVYYSYLLEETSVFICNMYVQWNSSNPDTIGPRRKCPYYGGVLISGVEKYTNIALGEEESVLFREMSLFQGCPYSGVPLRSLLRHSCCMLNPLIFVTSWSYACFTFSAAHRMVVWMSILERVHHVICMYITYSIICIHTYCTCIYT